MIFARAISVCAQSGGFDANGQCVGDRNGDGVVTVDEILTAVTNALNGCQLVPITLQFRGMVGSQTFGCGNTYHNIGITHADFAPADFRFYVHNIRLVTTEGKEVPLRLDQDGAWQYRDVALLDFENAVSPCNDGTPQTNFVVHGMAAPLTYTGVRFFLGVPFELDHLNEATAPSPLNLDGLFWSWQDGYKFVRIEGIDLANLNDFLVHVGSTGCTVGAGNVVTSCARPNVGEIDLDQFNPSTNVIVADLAALFADSDIHSNQPNTAVGCQSDPGDMDCVPLFLNLGINFSDGSRNPTSQKFFHVE
ncbi:MAG: MbnP family copper-binding protein [Candidatus Binatia bacterium]